jgi:hypothetical protein
MSGGARIVARAVGGRRLLFIVRVWCCGRWGTRPAGQRWRLHSGVLLDIDIVCWGKSIIAIQSHQCPIRICDIVYVEEGVFFKGELLVRLASVVVERSCLLDRGSLRDTSLAAGFICIDMRCSPRFNDP